MSLYRRFHDRFGAAGVALGVIALILALGGSALAAGALTGKQKKEVEKIAKKFAGKNGATGPAGPQGPAGAKGNDGANGQAGTNGKDGISPAGTTFAGAKGACSAGGVEYKGATTNLVCNGKAGEEGEPGEPGAIHPGETLPSGASETGSWGGLSSPSSPYFDVSFVIPLTSAPELIYVENPGVDNTTQCPGLTAGIPQASKGFLCVYRTFGNEAKYQFSFDSSNPFPFAPGDAGPSGTVLKIRCENEAEEPVESCPVVGVWAVTAGP